MQKHIDLSELCSNDDGNSDEFIIDDGDENVTEEDVFFDTIVGALENILIDEEFNSLQEDFCMSNCDVFEDTEECKLVYTDLFSSYTELIEGYIIERLTDEVEGECLMREERRRARHVSRSQAKC